MQTHKNRVAPGAWFALALAILLAFGVRGSAADDPKDKDKDKAPADTATTQDQAAPTEAVPTTQPAATAWPPGIMMQGLDAIGVGKPMRDLGLRVYGYIDAGMTFKIKGPGARRDGFKLRGFETQKPNNVRLNQVNWTLERPVDTSKDWDIGGRFDFMLGTDSKAFRENGLLENQRHDIQPNIPVGYGELWLKTGAPGRGFDIMFGEWYTTIGTETAYTPANWLYSRSLLGVFAEPATHTGLKVTYSLDPDNSVYFAAVRGWDNFQDNNDGASWMSGFTLSSKERMGPNPRSKLQLNTIVGPEQTGKGWPGNRFLLDTVWTWCWTEKLTQVLNFDYGFEDNVRGALSRHRVPGKRDAAWYGLSYMLNYAFNDYLSTTGRFDWLTDQEGARTGFRGSFFEATTGLSITPFPKHCVLKNLMFRPEMRWDWSAHNDPFTHDCQITAAFDVFYKF